MNEPADVVTVRLRKGLQLRDRDTILHGRETGVVKKLANGGFVEVHEPLRPAARHRLTAHEQHEPLVLEPAVDGHGVRREVRRSHRLRAWLSRRYFAEQVRKPSARHYLSDTQHPEHVHEITAGGNTDGRQ
ncbi:hypothetical protein LO772_31795 [Yinghuangia sp. ASG 101]|uniref:hypothetical protein n=1 Tax=Yinghuangia sp. ASG 101 TaxID=2896848 RepID=UPI001E56FA37|nr:hypothetical protein [Yinghuangia sp. ASG 101]UGQ11330.1 hypothetical protein LO772_31795 [Yinghuangia sp. ASG 101]